MAVLRKSSKKSKKTFKKKLPQSAQPPNEISKTKNADLPKKLFTKSKRVLRLLKKREPLLVENQKKAMFLRGTKTSPEVSSLLKDLYQLKKPDGVMYQRRNQLLPFEDETSLEFFSTKNDCSLFAFASHSKKRPNSLVLGRMFDHHILDMIELLISGYREINKKAPQFAVGNKPLFIFQGDKFQTDENFKKFSNLILDFFRGQEIKKINLRLDHVIICTSNDETIHFRHYSVQLKKSGSKIPHIELIDIGPSFDCTIRRTKYASEEIQKASMRIPKEIKTKKIKNIQTNSMKERIATVHMEKQDLNQMATRKMKAFRKKKEITSTTEEKTKEKLKKRKVSTGKKPKVKKIRDSGQ